MNPDSRFGGTGSHFAKVVGLGGGATVKVEGERRGFGDPTLNCQDILRSR